MSITEVLKSNEYKCAMCEGVFEKGWDDSEAIAETKELFGEVRHDDLDVVCDDCFKRLGLNSSHQHADSKGEK